MDAQTEAPPRERLPVAETLAPQLASAVVVAAPTPRVAATFLQRNRTVVLFLLLIVAADFAIGLLAPIWERHSPDEYVLRVQGCAREPRDLAFIGGSPVAEGIDPARIAGAIWNGKPLNSAYAMGLSGGTTSDFYHAVLRGCPTPPRMLVYGIAVTDLNDSRHEPHGPYSLMTWGDLGRWARLRPESREWVTRHFVQAKIGKASNLFRYRHGIRMWAATEADERIPGCCPETAFEANETRERADAIRTGNGYVPSRGYANMRFDAVKAAGLATQELTYLGKYRTGSHLKYLHKLIDWCAAAGVELVLIEMPVTADLEARYVAEFAEYRGRLAEVERDRGVRVIRANREAVGLGDAHFADLIHLNRDGAKLFSDWVKECLFRTGHHG